MSLLKKYFRGWRFRSTTPSLEPGREVNVFVNEYNRNGVGIANVGDTRLYIDGIESKYVGKRVRITVTEFDDEQFTGRGEFREVVGDSSYAG